MSRPHTDEAGVKACDPYLTRPVDSDCATLFSSLQSLHSYAEWAETSRHRTNHVR